MKRFAVVAVTVAALGTLLTATAPSAVAASSEGAGDAWRPSHRGHQSAPPTAGTPTKGVSAAAYNGACGAGYGVIDSAPLSTLGTVYLTYNGSSNCVATVRSNPGTAMYMVAGVRLTGSANWIFDGGQYTTYAGPVYVQAAGRCIDWGGQIGTVVIQKFGTHCG